MVEYGAGATGASNGLTIGASTKNVLSIDVGRGSSLDGSLNAGYSAKLTNNGILRVVAGAGVTNGVYTPITNVTWNDNGTDQGVGGTWDNVTTTSPSPALSPERPDRPPRSTRARISGC